MMHTHKQLAIKRMIAPSTLPAVIFFFLFLRGPPEPCAPRGAPCAGRCAPFLLFSMMSRLPKVLPARRMRKDGENCMFPHGAYAIVVYHIFGCQTSVHTGIGQIVCAHTVGVR